MSSSTSALDASWKTAIRSQRKGSFMFPEDVVVEELLDHIDNTWSVLWEGQPKRAMTSQEDTPDEETSNQRQPTEKKSLWSVVRRVLKLKRKPKDEKEGTSLTEGPDRCNSLIPRFPSGANWYDGTP
eukprot:g5591.t1